MNWIPPALALGLLSFRLIELAYRFPAERGKVEASWTLHALTAVGIATVIGSVVESLVTGAAVSISRIVAGIVLAGLALALRSWARRSLGRMWSIQVEIREQHRMVTDGPYRFVRHPIYVAAILELAAIPIALNAWIAGGAGLVCYAIAIAARLRIEEAAMARQFGPRWGDYCRTTGAVFPRW